LIAELIRLLGVLGLGLGAIAGGYGAEAVYERVRGENEHPDADTRRALGKFELTATQRTALWSSSAGLDVSTRNSRGLAFRLLRLRRVDARTGGPVSVGSALVGELFDSAWRAVTGRLFRSVTSGERDRIAALRPQMKEIERKYTDDPDGRRRAVIDFYSTNQVNPAARCARPLLQAMIANLLLALWTPQGQSTRDRLTRTVLVVDP
jgi:hypothetical protein